MPSYKDPKTGKWNCQFYYKDSNGNRKKKHKRGFELKRDADQWEKDFLQKMQGTPEMTLETFSTLYLDDIKLNCKPVTYRTRESRVRCWIVPYFAKTPLNSITALDVKNWQNWLKKSETVRLDVNGEPMKKALSTGYIGTLHRELSTMMNYAIKYYGLTKNPCVDAGNVRKSRKRSLTFWTLDQFEKFIATFNDDDRFRTAFLTLYWTGMRVGELQALTVEDVTDKTIRISKTFHIVNGEHVVTTTKTQKGNRTVSINQALAEDLKKHISRLYKPAPTDRVFTMTPSSYGKIMKEHTELAGLPEIRVHDIRHSHASLLIEMGFSPVAIADRLGHEKVSTTLDIYSHLYPSKQDELAEKLDEKYADMMKASDEAPKDDNVTE